MKAAIYARVSKERCTAPGCGHVYDEHIRGKGKCKQPKCKCRAYQGQDPENQLVELRRYAAAQAWEVVEYIDRASGKTAQRDAFKHLFEGASRREFGVVLVWALDRFTREGVAETFIHIRKLLDYGVQFESYSEPHFRTTGPAGELMFAVAAWIAKQERIRISERTKAGLARARAKGRIGGRPAIIFDRVKALQMRAQNPPVSWRVIARKLGVAQSSLRVALARVHDFDRDRALAMRRRKPPVAWPEIGRVFSVSGSSLRALKASISGCADNASLKSGKTRRK
jgi:DNA invertase Pin-like site-specific DNA recombinase